MDDDTSDLITQLCRHIGMIMEDHCDLALTIGRLEQDPRALALDRLVTAAAQISALSQAAKVLLGDVR